MRRRRCSVILVCLCTGCAPTLSGWGRATAAGALDEFTGDAGTQAIAATYASAAKAAADSARDELLGSATDAAIAKLISSAGAGARVQVDALLTDMLQKRIRQTVRLSIDEALGGRTRSEVEDLREDLVGPPLRADVDALIDAAAPHLAQALQNAIAGSLVPLQTDVATAKAAADAEAATWKPIAIAFAIGAAFLLVGLVLAVLLIRGHQRTIAFLARGGTLGPC